MKLLPLLFLSLISLPALRAQIVADAVRYSNTTNIGTARHYAVGGAMAALGGDFGVISTNPASLGIFRKSELTLTPAYTFQKTDAAFRNDNNVTTRNNGQFILSNVGMVIHTAPISRSIRAVNIALGYNHIGSFNDDLAFSGRSFGSIADRWIERADGLRPDQLDNFETGLAFDFGAIYDLDNDLLYDADVFPQDQVQKDQVVERSGGLNDFTIALGINLKDKLMIGASLGVPFVNYEEEKTYIESDEQDEIPIFNELVFGESLLTTGIGVNLKLGLNYVITQSLRVGAYVHTPTRMTLTDQFSTSLTNDFTEPGRDRVRIGGDSPEALFEYRLSTPWRIGGGLGYIINRKGFISADIEYVDFSSNRFDLTYASDNPDDAIFQDELNGRISDQLTSALNIRVGGELALQKFRARAGVSYRGQPEESAEADIISYRAGLGYRGDKYFLDFAYSLTDRGLSIYEPYEVVVSDRQIVEVERIDHLMMLTLGLKF